MRIAVIGVGNIGGAIIAGAIETGVVLASNVTIADPSPTQAEELKSSGVGVNYTPNNKEAVVGADMIIIAVKAENLKGVLEEISSVIDRGRQIVVSTAAGVTFAKMSEYLSIEQFGGIGLYRVVPNLAIAIRESLTFIASQNTYAEQDNQVMTLFKALGKVFVVGEKQIGSVTALSASGVAYAMSYLHAAAEGGFQMGMRYEESLNIVIDTMKGAIALLEKAKASPRDELMKVATPDSRTMKGLTEMEKGGFTQSVINGLLATKFE